MRRFRTGGIVAGVVGLSVVAHAQAARTLHGWTFAQRITIDSGNGQPPRVMVMRTMGAGRIARMDVDVPGMPAGAVYSLHDADSGTVTSVMATVGMAVTMHRPEVPRYASMFRAAPSGRMTVDTLGAGPVLLGFATTHIRSHSVTTIEATFDGVTCSAPQDVTTDLWVTGDTTIAAAMHRMVAALGATAPAPDTTAIPASISRNHSMIRMTMTKPYAATDGSIRQVITTTEVVEATAGPIAVSLLELPPGITPQRMDAINSSTRSGLEHQVRAAMFDTSAAAGPFRATCKPAP